MSSIASQITGVTIVCSTVASGADQRKHQSSASLAFVRGIHRWPVNSPHKRPVTRKMFPLMTSSWILCFPESRSKCCWVLVLWSLTGLAVLFTALAPSSRVTVRMPVYCRNCSTPVLFHPDNTSDRPNNTTSTPGPLGKIYLTTKGRLGNVLFQYAMLLVLRHNTSRPVYLISDTNMKDIFQGITIPVLKPKQVSKNINKLPVNNEIHPGVYEANYTASLPNTDIMICCYFQAYKYFFSIRDIVKKELTFHEKTRKTTRTILLKAVAERFGDTSDRDIRYVGMHIRRGDFTLPSFYKTGYRIPEASYFLKAKEYFKKRFPRRVLFVAASDDKAWVKKHLTAPDVYISEARSASQDMALLAACNDTIMSFSTFSWWAAFLAGGETVYFKDFIAPGSDMEPRLHPEDRFLTSDWIPMGNWTILDQP